MMPSDEVFQQKMKSMCIRISDTVVVYDSFGMAAAPRVSWMLRAMGMKNVYVLNSTLQKWMADGLPISKGQEENEPFSRSGQRPKTTQEAYSFTMNKKMVEDIKSINGKILIDTRKKKIFEKGHIPHSFNIPTANVLTEDGYRPMEDLKQALHPFLDKDVVVLSQNGVQACVLEVALRELGNDRVTVYDGSYFDYAQNKKF